MLLSVENEQNPVMVVDEAKLVHQITQGRDSDSDLETPIFNTKIRGELMTSLAVEGTK